MDVWSDITVDPTQGSNEKMFSTTGFGRRRPESVVEVMQGFIYGKRGALP